MLEIKEIKSERIPGTYTMKSIATLSNGDELQLRYYIWTNTEEQIEAIFHGKVNSMNEQ